MADSKPKPSSIPSWQQPNSASNPNTDNSESTSSPTSDDTSRSALIEQAAKFLEDESIRDAPTDRKVTFLQSKGLREDEINTLLDISTTPKASDTTEEEEKTASPDTTPPSSTEPAPAPEQTDNASASSTTQPTPSSSITTPTPSPTSPKTTTTRDIPPIITYPEFLSTPTKPPPLVTLRSVLYTLYGAAGLSASFYGASEYLIKPMLSNLTSARQELASTATSNLQKLNEKLEQNVSVIPESLKNKTANTENDSSSTDTESITSDPTELFHRDVATQTATSDFAATYNNNNKTGTDKDSPEDPTAAVTDHLKRLESIRSQLRECSDTEKESSTLDSGMRTRLNELHHYLDGLIYSKPGFNPLSGYGMYSTPGMDSGSGAATGVGKGEEDAIANFRAEIRGVKGALLSARNFPAGRGGRIGGVAGSNYSSYRVNAYE
ncbi:peroxisomal membrane anchor protein [Aspergillus costaricaensis CBS 115574]|uniref:peroxisomal membrane protein PEX14 n=1 Tax=Aspergillus costaricaensis CBS 115574 TaxID=1448317 RepID=UPI000DBD2BE7|nr:peroxisomal membrane anchor protein [Aspergillus costaricaensis CBS 115574]RAK85880.1 peroxisomal membrane anchor protein [Aspergillus costaricaensis CBS 115574]